MGKIRAFFYRLCAGLDAIGDWFLSRYPTVKMGKFKPQKAYSLFDLLFLLVMVPLVIVGLPLAYLFEALNYGVWKPFKYVFDDILEKIFKEKYFMRSKK